jgi:hypothetical protein
MKILISLHSHQNLVFSTLFYYYCCAGWGNIGIFSKVLTMCQIYLNSPPQMYHTWIYSLHCSLSSPLARFLQQSKQVSFLHLLIYVYIICTTPSSKQNLLCHLVLWFCRRKIIKDNKKNMVFLLVWNKDSYIGRFLVLFPCIHVLQPKFGHLKQTSSTLSNLLS